MEKRAAAGKLAAVALAAVIIAGLSGAERVLAYDDEVDYGAPYLTVENGELVTKDPKAEREKGTPARQAEQTRDSNPSAGSAGAVADGIHPVLLAGGIGLAVLGAVLFAWRWRN